jgi:hypothetical protein
MTRVRYRAHTGTSPAEQDVSTVGDEHVATLSQATDDAAARFRAAYAIAQYTNQYGHVDRRKVCAIARRAFLRWLDLGNLKVDKKTICLVFSAFQSPAAAKKHGYAAIVAVESEMWRRREHVLKRRSPTQLEKWARTEEAEYSIEVIPRVLVCQKYLGVRRGRGRPRKPLEDWDAPFGNSSRYSPGERNRLDRLERKALLSRDVSSVETWNPLEEAERKTEAGRRFYEHLSMWKRAGGKHGRKRASEDPVLQVAVREEMRARPGLFVDPQRLGHDVGFIVARLRVRKTRTLRVSRRAVREIATKNRLDFTSKAEQIATPLLRRGTKKEQVDQSSITSAQDALSDDRARRARSIQRPAEPSARGSFPGTRRPSRR